MMTHDAAAVSPPGSVRRPVADTARDTLAWLRAEPAYRRTGLTAAEEAEVLTAWRGRNPQSADGGPGTA